MMHQLFSSSADPAQVKAAVDICQASCKSCGVGNVDLSHLVPQHAQPSTATASGTDQGVKRDSQAAQAEAPPQPKEAKTC
eukprot:5305624-Karenia_brevis.AAC.1